jgi:hypothetical protein
MQVIIAFLGGLRVDEVVRITPVVYTMIQILDIVEKYEIRPGGGTLPRCGPVVETGPCHAQQSWPIRRSRGPSYLQRAKSEMTRAAAEDIGTHTHTAISRFLLTACALPKETVNV